MKKLYSVMMVLAFMVAALGFTACGDDDEKGGGNNEIVNRLIGTWTYNSDVLIMKSDRTGSYSGTYKPSGNFKFGNPYEIEDEEGEVWFLMDFTYTSGSKNGETIDWEIGYKKDDPNIIYIEGRKYNKAK